VDQGESLCEVFVEPEGGCHGARDLCDFDSVREAIPEVVGKPWREYLGLGLEPPKSTSMNNPVAVTLKRIAIGMFRFGISPAPALSDRKP